jgi:hypothetical protein
MSKTARRKLLEVQLDPESSDLFSEEAARCGLDPGVAAEQILKVFVERLRAERDNVSRQPSVSLYPQMPDSRWARFLSEVASDFTLEKKPQRAS